MLKERLIKEGVEWNPLLWKKKRMKGENLSAARLQNPSTSKRSHLDDRTPPIEIEKKKIPKGRTWNTFPRKL